jgi:hypothetical protein
MIKGISFIDPGAAGSAAGFILAGLAGSGIGAIAGAIPGSLMNTLVNSLSSNPETRKQLKTEKINQLIKNNPQLPNDLEQFVNNLIVQTPESILKMSNYITYLAFDYSQDEIVGSVGDIATNETERRIKELVKLVGAYFLQQEKNWEKLAAKYNIHPDTLYDVYNSLTNDGIEERWLGGLEQKISSPNYNVKENQGWAATLETVSANGTIANTSGAGAGMTASYQRRENQPVSEDYLDERRL